MFSLRGLSSPTVKKGRNFRSLVQGRSKQPSGLASQHSPNDFNLLCDNAGLHYFVYQGCETYERMTLEFLSTLSHNVVLMPNVDKEERITFRLMD
jgi:hypothetical protein